MSGIVFINYRRSNADAWAGRLHDWLLPRLSADRLFMDVSSIDAGADFVRVMVDKVTEFDVILAVIGPDWAQASDGEGRRRLDDPGDPVRVELATALAASKIVIPVLCGAAVMPKAEVLPDPLKPLATRNGVSVGHVKFQADMAALQMELDKALARAESRRRAEQERLASEARAAELARIEEAAERRLKTRSESARRKRRNGGVRRRMPNARKPSANVFRARPNWPSRDSRKSSGSLR